MDFGGRKILVVGMARSGLAVIKVLLKRGAIITACDNKTVNELGEVSNQLIEMGIKLYAGSYPHVSRQEYDLLVVSPGVMLDIKPVKEALELDIPVIGEVELAYMIKPKEVKLYAITGTNGKTTTTSLLQFILSQAGINALAGGNIGVPLTNLLEQMSEGTISLEMSSFQLETTLTFRPDICGMLNITPDHLDRHKNMESYIQIKAKIFANQKSGDYAVVNYEDLNLRRIAADCPVQVLYFSVDRPLEEGAFIKNNTINVVISGEGREICAVDEVSLKGKHNLENILCAVLIASIAGVSPGIIRQALAIFPGVRHRMEEVANHNGILYVNDSKATNPESVIKALDSFDAPLILIAGGRNKGSDFSTLAGVIRKKVKELILLGEAREEIKSAVMDKGFTNIYMVEDFKAGVFKAHELAREGDIVLLSPACASWDMFKSYEQRGDVFCEAVNSIIKQ